jgi:transcriptional regulator with XRE-family HTH domain
MAVLKLSEAGYRNIERGINKITIERLLEIAMVLNVDYISLLPQANADDKKKEENNLINTIKEQIAGIYESRLLQYMNENNFLKKMIEKKNGMV